MFDKFFDPNVNFIKCLLLTAGAILAIFGAVMQHYPALKQYEKQMNRWFIITATVSFLAFLNMGFLHYHGGFFHGYRVFNRYMTSKYFKEIGYYHLPEAALAADSEDAKFLKDVKQFRNQKDFTMHPAADALATKNEWRGNFSDSRWREFKDDLKFFELKGGRKINLNWWKWDDILTDDSYIDTPTTLGFARIITNMLPVTNKASLLLISFSDSILILLMVAAIFRSFGLQPATLFTILLCCNYAPFFSWSGNALLEMDWLALIVFAVCSLKKNDGAKAGAFTAAAACIQPFAAVFAVPQILKIISDKRVNREEIKFFTGFFVAATILILSSLIFLPHGISTWHDYFAKSALIAAQKLESWQWGMRDIFFGKENPSLLLILQLAATGGIFMAGKKLSRHENFLLGAVLLFVLFSLSKIYYIFTALFALLFAEKIHERWRIIALAGIFGLNAMMFVILSFQDSEPLLKFVYAAGLLGIICYSLYSIEANSSQEPK